MIATDDDVVYANYPAKRAHPYEKAPEVLGHILARVCRRGDLVLDPFAGSGSPGWQRRSWAWTWSGAAERAVNSRTRELRHERRNWLAGRYTHWGEPWCAGSGSPYHQEPCCEGCATVAWCRDRAAEIAGQIGQLESSLLPTVRGALW